MPYFLLLLLGHECIYNIENANVALVILRVCTHGGAVCFLYHTLSYWSQDVFLAMHRQ